MSLNLIPERINFFKVFTMSLVQIHTELVVRFKEDSIAGGKHNGHVDRKVDSAWNATLSCADFLPQERSLQPQHAVQMDKIVDDQRVE